VTRGTDRQWLKGAGIVRRASNVSSDVVVLCVFGVYSKERGHYSRHHLGLLRDRNAVKIVGATLRIRRKHHDRHVTNPEQLKAFTGKL